MGPPQHPDGVITTVRLHECETIGVHWNTLGLQSRFADPAIELLKWAGNLYWWAMLALALVGALRLALRRPLLLWITSPPVLIWTYFTAVYAVTVIQAPYHFAFIPCVAILAACALVSATKTLPGAARI